MVVCYLDSIGEIDIKCKSCYNQFRFGDGKVFCSKATVNIAASIGDTDVYMKTVIVDCEIPLLLPKESKKLWPNILTESYRY